MADYPQPTLTFATATEPENCIVIKYTQPPDPALVNCVMEILVNVTWAYTQTNPLRSDAATQYIIQLQPILWYLYDRSVNQVVTHHCVPKPNSQAVHIAPTDSDFDKLLVELSPMETQSQTVNQPQYWKSGMEGQRKQKPKILYHSPYLE